MEWVRGTTVPHAIDLHRRSHMLAHGAARTTDCVKFELRAGRGVALGVNALVSRGVDGKGMAQTWKRVKPPSETLWR